MLSSSLWSGIVDLASLWGITTEGELGTGTLHYLNGAAPGSGEGRTGKSSLLEKTSEIKKTKKK